MNRGGEVAQDFPFGLRLADLARNFRAEHDASLRARFRPAIVLLVARFRREQKHFPLRFDEHLVGKNDVLVNSCWHIGQSASYVLRLGQRAQKISTETIKQIELTSRAGLNHFRRSETDPVRNRKTVLVGKVLRVLTIDWFSSRKHGRISAHLGAALHRRMAANRHQSALVAADEPLHEAQVQNHLHCVTAEGVLGNPHAPDQHGSCRVADQPGEFLHPGTVQTALRFQLREFQICALRFEFVESNSVVADKPFVNPPIRDEDLQHSPQKGYVAALRNWKPVISEAGAEQCTAQRGRHPVTRHARFEVRVHQQHLCASFLGFMQILRRHRLVVGRICAEENDQVSSVPVFVTACGRGDTNSMFHRRGAWRMAEAGRVINVVGAKETRNLLRHIIDFICDTARGEKQRPTPGIRGADSPGHKLICLIPGDATETLCSRFTKHRIRQTTQLAELRVVE